MRVSVLVVSVCEAKFNIYHTFQCELLLSNRSAMPDDRGLERDSPIISAILASPVIQLALPKPKTLLGKITHLFMRYCLLCITQVYSFLGII